MLSPAELTRARTQLAALAQPVTLALFTQPDGCDSCDDTRQIVSALAKAAPALRIEAHDLSRDAAAAAYGIDRAPALAILGTSDPGIRFLGAPVGHELTSLLDAITLVAGGDSGLSTASRARLAGLGAPVSIQVFSTPTCVYCGQAVALAHRMALESRWVSSTAVSVVEYPDLISRYRVTGVPKIVINERVELLGAQTEEEFVAAVAGAVED